MSQDDDRRASDRRQAADPAYPGGERRKGERRQPVGDMADAALCAAYQQTDGAGPRAHVLIAEIERRGLDV